MEPRAEVQKEILSWEECKKEMFEDAKKQSDDFIKDTNHPDGAFHDFRHFLNVSRAGQLVLEAAQKQKLDPTDFWGSLTQFCQTNNISFEDEDLIVAIDLFAMGHDQANMLNGLIEENGILIPSYIKGTNGKNLFSKKDAEARSSALIETYGTHYLRITNISEERKNNILLLTKALIGETTFPDPDLTKPFAKFARVVDQIGQALVDDKPEEYTKVQFNLLNEEEYDPDGFKNVDVMRFGNFITNQLNILTVGDKMSQEQILHIFTGGKEIPKYLVYEADDPRIKELKIHPLSLRTELINKLEQKAVERQKYLNSHPDIKKPKKMDLKREVIGALHELLSDIETRNGTNPSPAEKEILYLLQHPENFGFTTNEIPRNPDLIKLTYLDGTNSWIISEVVEATTSKTLSDRKREQLGNDGIIKGLTLVCRVLNNMKISHLKEKKLISIASMREGAKHSESPHFALAKDFKITVMVPFDNDTLGKSIIDEFGINRIQTEKAKHTRTQLDVMAKGLLNKYKIPQKYQGLFKNQEFFSPR